MLDYLKIVASLYDAAGKKCRSTDKTHLKSLKWKDRCKICDEYDNCQVLSVLTSAHAIEEELQTGDH